MRLCVIEYLIQPAIRKCRVMIGEYGRGYEKWARLVVNSGVCIQRINQCRTCICDSVIKFKMPTEYQFCNSESYIDDLINAYMNIKLY